jgi:hypothetical protein
MTVTHIREICEIADKHCDGHLRFTTRNNIEFMVDDKSKVEPLVKDLESRKFDGGSLQVSRGRHRCRRHQHRSHPGLDPLPHPGDRCFRSGQGRPWTSCSTTSRITACRPSCASLWPAA